MIIKFFRKDFYAKHFRIILIDIIMQYAKVSPIPASYFYFRSKYLSDHLSKIIIKISTQFSNHFQIQDFAFLIVLRPSSCIWDQDLDQAQKNVILGSSSDPRIKIKDQDQVLGIRIKERIKPL